MRVSNLTSPRSGSPVANQYEIEADDGSVTFQSYQTPIAKKKGYVYTVSSDWNYSRTTSKYFYQWLRTYGWNQFEIETLKKWLNKDTTKEGSELVELLGRPVTVKYVEEL